MKRKTKFASILAISAVFLPLLSNTTYAEETTISSKISQTSQNSTASGTVTTQDIPPATEWELVRSYNGSSKQGDTLDEFLARASSGIPALWNKYAGVIYSSWFNTIYDPPETRYYSTNQYIAPGNVGIAEIYIYSDSKRTHQIDYEFKEF